MLAMLEGEVVRAGPMPLRMCIQTRDWDAGKRLQNVRIGKPASKEGLGSEATGVAKIRSMGARAGG